MAILYHLLLPAIAIACALWWWKPWIFRGERYEVRHIPEKGWLVYDRKEGGFISAQTGNHVWREAAGVKLWCIFPTEEEAKQLCAERNTFDKVGCD